MPPADAGGGPQGSTRRPPTPLLAAALLLLAARVAIGLYEQRHPPPSLELVHWRPPGTAVAEARAQGKPMLYDFTADWCAPCQAMKREVFADRAAAEQIDRMFVPVRILDRIREEGRNPAFVDSLQRRFGVNSFPTLVVVPASGGDSIVLVGYPGKGPTLQRLLQARLRTALPSTRPGVPTFP